MIYSVSNIKTKNSAKLNSLIFGHNEITAAQQRNCQMFQMYITDPVTCHTRENKRPPPNTHKLQSDQSSPDKQRDVNIHSLFYGDTFVLLLPEKNHKKMRRNGGRQRLQAFKAIRH